MKRILICGGGGVKGALQVEILKEIEKRGELDELDLIMGTSVGAINGSILASGKLTAEYLSKLYPELIKRVFKKKFFPSFPIYDRKNFIEVWMDIVGMQKMGSVKIPLIITSVDFVEKKTHFFKSWEDTNEYILTVVLRSFAAPLYFGMIPDDKTQRVYGDGGMGDDNLPITEGILEVINKGWIDEEVKFTIVGTGFSDIKEDYDHVKKQKTVAQLIDFMKPSDGGFARMVSRQKQIGQLEFISKKFNNIHFDYYDIEIPKRLDKMDNVKAFDEYISYGYKASQKPLKSM